MKIFISFCLLIINLTSFSQGYQIADTTKSWNTLYTGIGSFLVHFCGGTQILHLSDVSNTGDQYLDVLMTMDTANQEWEIIGQIREDTSTRKVYFRTSENDTDGIIYDFSLEPGDTILVDNHWWSWDIDTMMCDSVDFVNINGEQKKRIFLYRLDSPYYPCETWIEGIGSNLGLLYSGSRSVPSAGGSIDLLCCSQNGNSLWMNSNYPECYYDTFYPLFLSHSYDTAYLDTYYEYKVSIDTGNADSIELVGYIPVGFSFNSATGILSGIPSQLGLFGCVITVENLTLGFLTDMIHSDIVVVLPTNTNAVKPDDIRIFPNPFSSELTLEVPKGKGRYYLELYSADGRLVKKFGITESLSIDLSSLDKGVYLAKVMDKTGNMVLTETMVKQ